MTSELNKSSDAQGVELGFEGQYRYWRSYTRPSTDNQSVPCLFCLCPWDQVRSPDSKRMHRSARTHGGKYIDQQAANRYRARRGKYYCRVASYSPWMANVWIKPRCYAASAWMNCYVASARMARITTVVTAINLIVWPLLLGPCYCSMARRVRSEMNLVFRSWHI